ncbi:MAG: hypothetical protein ABIO86_19250 [Sphingomonas sp.]
MPPLKTPISKRRHTDAAAAPAQAAAILPVGGLLEFRIHVFGDFRGPWRESFAEAKWDAIDAGLASYDEERGEYYLAVPVGVAQRQRVQAIAA